MTKLLSKSILTMLITAFSISSFAGWYIIEEERLPDGTTTTRKMYLENKKLKHSEGEFDFIYDQNEGVFTYVNHKTLTYWTGTLEQYKNEYAIIKKAMEEQALAGMDETQRNNYKKLLAEQEAQKNAAPEPIVKIKKTDTQKKILEFNCTKYEVYVNGELKEKIFLSKEADIYSELDFERFSNEMKQISDAGKDDYTNNDEYSELFKNSFPMLKAVAQKNNINGQFNQNQETTEYIVTEVVFTEEKDISNSTFTVPQNYQKLSLYDFMMKQ